MRKHIVQGTHKAQMLLAKSVAQMTILHIGGNKQIVLIEIQWYNPPQGYPNRAMPCEKNTNYIICVKYTCLTSYRCLDSLYASNHSANFRRTSHNGVEGLNQSLALKGSVGVCNIILILLDTYLFAIPPKSCITRRVNILRPFELRKKLLKYKSSSLNVSSLL